MDDACLVCSRQALRDLERDVDQYGCGDRSLLQPLATYPFANGRRVTASFGIAALPEDVAPAADDLIRAAYEALYAAKRAGKNRVSVFEDVGAAAATTRSRRRST